MGIEKILVEAADPRHDLDLIKATQPYSLRHTLLKLVLLPMHGFRGGLYGAFGGALGGTIAGVVAGDVPSNAADGALVGMVLGGIIDIMQFYWRDTFLRRPYDSPGSSEHTQA